MRMKRQLAIATLTMFTAMGCATSSFEKHLDARRWSAAAEEFSQDSSLQRNERALFQAALLHAFPNRETYNPAMARTLLERHVRLYPDSPRHQRAVDHLSLLEETETLRRATTRKIWESEVEVTRLVTSTQQLLSRIDSLNAIVRLDSTRGDSLQRVITQLESDLKERDDQLRALRAELGKLKAIDLDPVRRQ